MPTPDTAVLAGAVLLALAWDWVWGEPPAVVHPVVVMGFYLGAAGRWAAPLEGQAHRASAAFARGALGWLWGAGVVVGLGVWCEAWIHPWPALWQAVVLGLALKPLLAWRMLRDEVASVETALAVSLEEGRQRVARLVSRDVSALTDTQVREAAVSTLAENLNDSVVAPLFWFVVAGLPGALLYRFANTADAMWGYPGPRGGRDWAWAGKWAARVDDALSWLPARLTAALIGLLVFWRQPTKSQPWFRSTPWRLVAQQARLTPSPNGGWPMGALALGLGIRLGKPGVYDLNSPGRAPGAADTLRALQCCGQVVALLGALAVVVCLGALV
ncbi:MAG: hypothetical protein RJA09_2728 [Pseudomonadota bacterium]